MLHRLRGPALTVSVLCLASLLAAAQEGVPPPTATPETVAAVPLPEIAKRSDDTFVFFERLEERAVPGVAMSGIEDELPPMSKRLRALRAGATRLLPTNPPLREVDEVLEQLQEIQTRCTEWATLLTTRATELEEEIGGLDRLRAIWRATRDEAKAAGAPAAVRTRIADTTAAISKVRKRIEAHRAALLVLQDRVVKEAATARDLIRELTAYRRDAVGRLLVRDSPPVWETERWSRVWSDGRAHVSTVLADGLLVVRDYLNLRLGRLLLQAVLFAVLVLIWSRARARTARWLAEDESLAPVAAVFEHPWSAALFLTALSSIWFLPQAPLMLRYALRAACVPPVLRILDRLVDRPILPALFALGGFFLADQLRGLFGGLPLIEQLVFLVEMLGAIGVLGWMVRRRQLHRLGPRLGERAIALLDRLARAGLVLFAVAFVAAGLGYMHFARLVAGAVLGAAYAAILLFALMRVLQGLWAYALRTRLLRRLRAVELHRPLLERRGNRLLVWLTVGTWTLAALDLAELLAPLRDGLREVVGARLTVGTFSLSLSGVIAFVVTVWLAFLVSRFARFILEEDVYPRVRLARGLPYALSNMLHYGLLLIGFFIALSAAGLSLDRFALLAGAFGVGIGFGMQNVVNNFVSGLILLFERPVQVGDTVEIGTLLGEVRRIGIRSSTVRTVQGAEVIVPNGNLISDSVTNWTLSDRMRRIEITVGVAYGTDPEQVLELLRGVAVGHPRVVKTPAPQALFTGFGESSLDFELRAWTDRFEEWVVMRSELAVRINRTLAEAGITIPFPQRDLHLVSAVPVRMAADSDRSKT